VHDHARQVVLRFSQPLQLLVATLEIDSEAPQRKVCLYPGLDFLELEGLGDVVHTANSESLHLV